MSQNLKPKNVNFMSQNLKPKNVTVIYASEITDYVTSCVDIIRFFEDI